jgi:hypothetical protein
MNVLQTDMSLDVTMIGLLAFIRLGVDLWDGVEQLDDIGPCSFGGGDVGYEGEYISGIDSSESGTLSEQFLSSETRLGEENMN